MPHFLSILSYTTSPKRSTPRQYRVPPCCRPRQCRVPPAAAGRQGRLPLANRAIEHDPGHHRLECPGSSLSGNRFPVPLIVALMGECEWFSPPAKHSEGQIYARRMRVQVRQQLGPGTARSAGPTATGCRATEHEIRHHQSECRIFSFAGTVSRYSLMCRCVGFSPPTEHSEGLIYARRMR